MEPQYHMHQTPIKNTNYQEILEPYTADFYNNPMRRSLKVCIWCPLFNFLYWIDRTVFYYIFGWIFDRYMVKSVRKDIEKAKQQKIRKTVRSYRTSFQKFNNPDIPTCFEKNENETFFVRSKQNIAKTHRILF